MKYVIGFLAGMLVAHGLDHLGNWHREWNDLINAIQETTRKFYRSML